MKLRDCLIELEDRSFAGPSKPADDDTSTKSEPVVGDYNAKGSLAEPESGEYEDRTDAGMHKPASESLELDDMRIVESVGSNSLTSLDDDDTVMGVPLKLDEACSLDFDKHMDVIVKDIKTVVQQSDIAQQNKQEYDRRYKEMPRYRIKFTK